jgi:hypothetical protein
MLRDRRCAPAVKGGQSGHAPSQLDVVSRRHASDTGEPPQGVDFYNTWGIPYDLFWIHTLDPNFDPLFMPTRP